MDKRRRIGLATIRCLISNPSKTSDSESLSEHSMGEGLRFREEIGHHDLWVRVVSIWTRSWCLPLFMPGHPLDARDQAWADDRLTFQKGHVRH